MIISARGKPLDQESRKVRDNGWELYAMRRSNLRGICTGLLVKWFPYSLYTARLKRTGRRGAWRVPGRGGLVKIRERREQTLVIVHDTNL